MLLPIARLIGVTSIFIAAYADTADDIKAKIKQAITMTVGNKRAMYYGWHDNKGHNFSDAIGNRDRDQKVEAEVTDQIPMGSLTKSYVATALMTLVDQKKLHIDDGIIKHIDPWLSKYMNLSLSSIFPGPSIGKVTIRELIHMTAGLTDYDDNYVWGLSVYTDYDVTPYMYLTNPGIFTPSWLFTPGEGLAYSSIGFTLAGMVLASTVDKPWNEVLASDFISQEFMNVSKGFQMTGEGPCSQYEYVPHLYSFNRTLYNKSNADPYPSKISKRSYFIDMYSQSCLNGWMFGNIITTAWDGAYYMFSLFSPHASTPLISKSSLDQVTDFELATAGFGLDINLTYGLGSMKIDLWNLFETKLETRDEYRYWVGHAGMDYGSGGLAFYIPGLDGGLSIMWNSDPGSSVEVITLEYSACKIMEIIINSFMPSGGPEASCGNSVKEFEDIGLKSMFL